MNAKCLQTNVSGKHASFAVQNQKSLPKLPTTKNLKRVPLKSLVYDFGVKKDSFKLTAQTQEELLREFRRRSDRKAGSHRHLEFQSRSGPIRPINVHLLTGSSLKTNCSVAEIVSEKFIGRSTHKKHLGRSQDHYLRRNVRPCLINLETLRSEITKADVKPIDPVICTQPFHGQVEDPQNQALFKPSRRGIHGYKPWSRFLWFIHPDCDQYTEVELNGQESEFSEARTARIRKTSDHLRKPSQFSPRSSYTLSKHSPSHRKSSTVEFDDENPHTELDAHEDVDAVDNESRELKELEAAGAIQLTASENEYIESYNHEHTASVETDAFWKLGTESPQRLLKTNRYTASHRMSSPNPYADQLLRNQSVYQYDRNAVLLASLAMDNKRTIRRLLLRLSEECTPSQIYERYRRKGSIVLSAAEYAASYGPHTLQSLKSRWYNMLGSSKPVINDNVIMRLLHKRLDEMRRSELTKLEQDLQTRQSQRFQNLLLHHFWDQQLVKSELLKEGELCHQRCRQDPVILQRRQASQPAFGLNPLKELYRASFRDTTEVLVEKYQKSVGEEVTTSIQQYHRKRTGKNKKFHRRPGKPTKTIQSHSLELREKDLRSVKQSWHFYDADMESPYEGEQFPDVASTIDGNFDILFDQDVSLMEEKDTHEICLVKKLAISPVPVDSCLLATTESGELDSSNCTVMKMYTAAKRLLNLGVSTEEDNQLPNFVTADSQATMQGIDVSLLE